VGPSQLPYFELYQRGAAHVDSLKATVARQRAEHALFVRATEPKKVGAVKTQMAMRTMACGFALLAWRKCVRDTVAARALSAKVCVCVCVCVCDMRTHKTPLSTVAW